MLAGAQYADARKLDRYCAKVNVHLQMKVVKGDHFYTIEAHMCELTENTTVSIH